MQPFWSYSTSAAQVTTDSYADVVFVDGNSGEGNDTIRAFTSGPLSFMLRNVDAANGISYRILASNDDSLADANWAIVTAEAALAALAKIEITHALAYYLFYKVQVKASAAGNQGDVECNAVHKRV